MTKQSDAIFEGKSVGQLLAASLTEFADDLKSGVDITKVYSCRNVKLEPKAMTVTPERVIKARQTLGVSQALFADFLGFSANSIRAWEQGVYQPQRAACLLMEYILEDPAYWRAKLSDRIHVKTKTEKRTTKPTN
jgi:DNA-binding transcriptional regulator YiaG